MSDDDISKGFVRLELMIGNLGKDLERRLIPIESSIRTLSNEVATLRSRQSTLEGRIVEAHEVAVGAMRKSSESISEVQGISIAVQQFVNQQEASRVEATKQHAKRFDAQHESLRRQGDAITSLRKSVDHRGHVSTILLVVSMALIPALTAAAVQVLQEIKTPAHTVAEKDASP